MPPSPSPSPSTNGNKLSQQDCSMDINMDSIRALEGQIREHEAAIIKLKRARNSLLNVSKLPPEILGEIFRWNATHKRGFGPLEERSHNFLTVCHYWFEVASNTPELWGFWGNKLEDWAVRHLRHPTAPLDLVLDEFSERDTLDDSLQSTLQDRAAQDNIRWIHLSAGNSGTLNSIISSLTACDGIRTSGVESVIICCWDEGESTIVSNFLAYSRFPKLRRLRLQSCTISSWDLIASSTSVLTTLTLDSEYPTPTITSPQILSILRSNPSLQEVGLSGSAIPEDDGGNSRVSLTQLKKLVLDGRRWGVFTLLHQLDYPRNMDSLLLDITYGAIEDISGTIGPYLRDYLGRGGRSQSGLEIHLSSDDSIRFCVEDAGRTNTSAPEVVRMDPSVVIILTQMYGLPEVEEAFLVLIAHVPREEVTVCRIRDGSLSAQAVSAQLPNLRAIHFEGTPLGSAFPIKDRDINFPHLQRIHITFDRGVGCHCDWSPLTTLLDHLASSGNRLDTLEIDGSYSMSPWEEERIRTLVRELRLIGGDDQWFRASPIL
ncbi:hypothetical protein BJ322DRAFT_1214732 [Thelephora terrestris]|uniref:F-box domain-containing protein n=1 Tax=Thelephora terrestris TaxID=56493 RepID=A0A9P6H2Z0_9AGAM|nr:hypothetical protein BJ322DRAFT_1214732 [Thelephora terrestris]